MNTVRVYRLQTTPKMFAYFKAAQVEVAKVWNLCCEIHKEARLSQAKWPERDELQKATKRHHNQRMSLWEYGKDIHYLIHKAKQAHIMSFTGSERGTSSQCPVCEHKQKPKGRNWVCKACGFTGHRDLVGSVNMHPIAYDQKVVFPRSVTYLRPGLVRRS